MARRKRTKRRLRPISKASRRAFARGRKGRLTGAKKAYITFMRATIKKLKRKHPRMSGKMTMKWVGIKWRLAKRRKR